MNCKLGKLLLSVEKELAKAKSTLGHKDIDMEVSDCQPGIHYEKHFFFHIIEFVSIIVN